MSTLGRITENELELELEIKNKGDQFRSEEKHENFIIIIIIIMKVFIKHSKQQTCLVTMISIQITN